MAGLLVARGGTFESLMIVILLAGVAHLVLDLVSLVWLMRDWHGEVRRLRRLPWLWGGVAIFVLLGMLPFLNPEPTHTRLFGLPVIIGTSQTRWQVLLFPLPATVAAALAGWASLAPRSAIPRVLLLLVLLAPVGITAVAVATQGGRTSDVDAQLAETQAAIDALERAQSVMDEALVDVPPLPITPDPDDGVGPVEICGRSIPREETWLVPMCPRDDPDRGLRNLGALKELRMLDLGYSEVTDAGLPPLRSLTKLTTLDLMLTMVGDEGLQHLAGLTQLEKLDLARTKVTGRGFVHLKELQALRELDLDWAPVTDEHLHHLASLSGLQELTLSRTKITDAGLEHLATLSGLERLYVSADGVTAAGVERLRARLPDCEIVREDGEE